MHLLTAVVSEQHGRNEKTAHAPNEECASTSAECHEGIQLMLQGLNFAKMKEKKISNKKAN